ncbi:conserved hypothetical protein [Tenacibaculum sediminilitoris]|uniref:2TM domain-containing protein n=1 Tax=Tenacibaculum sediminilitoris TaxID=1820334 RepID=UPI003893070E
METNNYNQEQKYLRAQKRVGELKKYYLHLTVYILVNIFISVKKIIRNINNGETFEEAFFDVSTYALWFFWGIGILFHTFKMFGFNLFLGENWEERKINEYMKEQISKNERR